MIGQFQDVIVVAIRSGEFSWEEPRWHLGNGSSSRGFLPNAPLLLRLLFSLLLEDRALCSSFGGLSPTLHAIPMFSFHLLTSYVVKDGPELTLHHTRLLS